jgi:hypothetical protein
MGFGVGACICVFECWVANPQVSGGLSSDWFRKWCPFSQSSWNALDGL